MLEWIVRKRDLRSQSGYGMVEVALSFPIFFMLIMGIIQFANISYTKLNMRYALTQAARYMVTGQGYSTANANQRRDQIISEFCNSMVATGFKCESDPVARRSHFTFTCVNPTVCTSGPVSCAAGCTYSVGGPNQTVTVTANFTKPILPGLFKKSGTITLSAQTTWKNEPFL